MIEGRKFVKIVEGYFTFLEKEFKFKLSEEEIRGNAYYDIQYRD
jgi:hypothetical protein